ncbi:TIR domain-containing protein [Cellulomonas sp. NPDC058312]|uniref:TIR domain-containing protein n=1 Tax=Cellulomonas sp. NPDC058312 TaxID=3346441 RepID=UPI0036EF1F2A
MARSSFVSFHYQRDSWRVQEILNMGALDGQEILPAQRWEAVKRQGKAAIKAWIDQEMNYKQAVIVMIGHETASREWVQYEIQRAWSVRKPLLGILIHGLKDSTGHTDTPGPNPFAQFRLPGSTRTYAAHVPVFDPASYTGLLRPASTDIHRAIAANISSWATNGYKRP